jgi:hypothetical protein
LDRVLEEYFKGLSDYVCQHMSFFKISMFEQITNFMDVD